MTETTQHYDYTSDKNDTLDKIGFGTHKNWTPADLLMHKPSYMVWAWRKTKLWVGSEEIVRRAHKIVGEPFKPREDTSAQVDNPREELTIESFEATCLQTFGCFPYKSWNTI